jgi:Ca-activated chloride channel homolog
VWAFKELHGRSCRRWPLVSGLPFARGMTPTARLIAIVAVVAPSLSLSLLPLDARAQVQRPPDDRTLSPYFLVEGGDPAVDRLPLKDTSVEVSITGVIADVTVRQLYENHGTRPIHARYVFPASTRAAVYGMTMTVGEVRIVATIRERERAAKEFQTAKRQGKSAALLEQARPNVFTMQVANVLPGDTIAVELRYTELLVPTDGTYEFVHPTVVGPRYSERRGGGALPGDDFVRTPYTRQGEAPQSTFRLSGTVSTGVPIQDLVSPSHEIVLRPIDTARTEVTLADAERFSGNRDFILRYRLSGQTIASGLLLHEGGDENFFLLLAEPPRAIAPDAIPPREYVFVVDVSGSMNGFPLETAKTMMRDLVDVLRPSDSFNVLVFADGSETFAPASVTATPGNLQRALQFIGRKQGGGGTRLLASLETAVALPRQAGVSRSIVLLTDGYIEAEADVFDYVRGQLDGTNVFAFGIGSSVNRHLIEGVARAGLGEPFVVTAPGEAADAASRFRHYIDSPVLTGIEVAFRGFDVYDVEPARVPDLFASRPIVVFGKWRGRAAGSIEITGTTGHGPYGISVPVTSAQADERHGALRHLWARARIADLSDFAPRVPDDARVTAITGLGLRYGLLTRYTSFVAVQERVRRTGDGAEDVDQPLPLPAGVSDMAVGITSGSEPKILWACALAALLLVSARVARQGRPGRAR